MNFFKDYESIKPKEETRAEPKNETSAITAEDVKSYFEAMKEGIIAEVKAMMQKPEETPEEKTEEKTEEKQEEKTEEKEENGGY